MRAQEDSARRAAQSPRARYVDLRLPLTRDVTSAWRGGAQDDAPLPADAVLRLARALAARPGAWLLGGGEPLARPDLWTLLPEVAGLRDAPLGLYTAGQGLTAAVAARLHAAGVARLFIPFHCARQDAHDWLVGRPGALKAALRAIRVALDAGLAVTADVVLTRPTAPHLAETIEVLARVGVRAVCARRLHAAEAVGTSFVPLSPRLGLLESSLERAAAIALERRVRLRLRELPLCVAPRLRPLFAAPDSELWCALDGTLAPRAGDAPGCATCPGAPRCAGAPDDYTARFGWEEFGDRPALAARVRESVDEQRAPQASAPLQFAWRGPQRVRCAACGDAADAAAAEATRGARARLVQAARYRPAVLRLVGAELLAHPDAARLLYDAVRLFACIEVAGEASPLAEWSDLDLRRLKELRRLDVALYGPDAATHDAHLGIPGAFAGMLRAVERLRTRSRIPIGAYAIVHAASDVAGFAAAWQRGELPGEPRFRLAASGGALEELFEAARALPDGPARAALLALLPRCGADGVAGAATPAVPRFALAGGRPVPAQPCGSDPRGAFAPCQDGAAACAVPECPGTPVGWHTTTRSTRWTVNI